ncbi:uncharacterized protein TRUGW13939_08371 [Talaromyces rugulosus]|uniref:Uncharacterized protein n=1 Tax=Talaromyces rugulosus TaxID=121627 RepID=A0A7H8R4C7_TALRU|nr:uncharacterized protein TRUGW13939_08371 [Talaromyces rugulosus]QKX61224.1 hypothetical protein TRUGW13939_08371 [Talaromyces rugulosus]
MTEQQQLPQGPGDVYMPNKPVDIGKKPEAAMKCLQDAIRLLNKALAEVDDPLTRWLAAKNTQPRSHRVEKKTKREKKRLQVLWYDLHRDVDNRAQLFYREYGDDDEFVVNIIGQIKDDMTKAASDEPSSCTNQEDISPSLEKLGDIKAKWANHYFIQILGHYSSGR